VIRALAFSVLLAFSLPAHAQNPLVRVVFMTADWCPNCQALRPELDAAISRVEGAARIDMDVTTAARRARSAETAIANGVVAQHDLWIGKTGFAAIVDATTRQTLGCVTASWKAPEIEGALRRAVSNARNHASQSPRLSTCPA
jgi:hypothetical protein